jgi:serine/threonine-protein kinase
MSEPVDIEALLPPGTVLGGKYEVARVLGRGGMGVVVAARHLKMNRDVALKILLPALRTQPEIVARFEREGRAAAQIRNEHVARVLDVDALPDGSPFIVMEMLRGNDLGDILAARGKLPPQEAVGYLLEACAGMVEAHRAGIVHRDLKPNNLFIDRQGARPVLKILDFGISKVTDDVSASMTATTTVFGTPLYMSPEQVRSTKNVDARADIWSLGVVLYELLAGEPPFTAPAAPAIIAAIIADRPKPIAERRPDLPQGLADVVMRALEKDPAARWPDVQSFAAALAPFGPEGAPVFTSTLLPTSSLGPTAASTNVPVGAATTAPRAGRPLAAIGAGMGMAFVAGGILLVMALRRTPHAAPTAETAMPPALAASSSTAPVITPAASALPPAPVETAAVSAAPPKSAAPLAKAAVPPPAAAPSAKPSATPTSTPPAKPVVTAAPKPPPPPDDPKYL